MITHAIGVSMAAGWLKKKYPIVITELNHGGSEQADALAFNSGESCMVEVKISRSDFLADAKKWFRLYSDKGVGTYRYYLCPEGLIQTTDLPLNYGLLWVVGQRIRVMRKAEALFKESRTEISILVSLIRRIGQSCPKGVNIKCYTHGDAGGNPSKETATVSIEGEVCPINLNKIPG